jgi:molecular chaperone Hsp33
MDCQFCHEVYLFDEIDIANIHAQNLDTGLA